jgi:RNA polymerase sigma factor (sigma-70 family)
MYRDAERIAGLYYADLAKTTPVSADEERQLIFRWKHCGDVAARNELIRSHLRFVVTLARRLSRDRERLPDLIAAGNLGLMKALDHYDLSKQTRLLSYAGVWIQSEMLKEEYDASTPVHVPTHRKKAWRKKAKEFHKALAEFGPDDRQVRSLDPGQPEGTTITLDLLRDAIAEDDRDRTAERLEADDARLRLRHAISNLSPKQQTVLNLYFGMKDTPRNMVQIAALLDVSPERVRHLKISALRELKHVLEEESLRSIDDDF